MTDVVKHIPNFKLGMRLAFIPTAAEVEIGSLSWLHADRKALVDVGFDVFDFSFKDSSPSKVRAALDTVDVIMVAGGNTFFLLQEMQKSGSIEYLRERVNTGMVYMGSSAGSIVAGPSVSLIGDLDDRNEAPDLQGDQALGLIDIVVFPHWGNKFFEKSYDSCMQNCYKKGNKVVLLTDDQYLWVKDDWYQIMSV